MDSKGNKAGKGPLLSENLSMTLGTSQDQYLFQPIVIDPVGGQAERAWQTDVSPTLKATHYKFPPTVMMSAGFKPGQGAKAKGMGWEMEKSPTLLAGQEPGVCVSFEPGALKRLGNSISRNISGTLRATMGDNQMAVAYSVENHPSDSRYRINDSGIVQTLRSRMGTGGGNEPIVMLEQKTFDARGNGDGETTSTITGDHENRITDYTNVVIEPFSKSSRAKTSRTLDLNGGNPACNQGGIIVCQYWDGSQTAGTLTANNAGGSQRMPDKENFNCVIQMRRR